METKIEKKSFCPTRFVYSSYFQYVITLAAQQDIPSNCEIWPVIEFLNVEKVSGVKILGWLCAVYRANKVM